MFCSEVNSTAALEAELSATALGAIWVASKPRGLKVRNGDHPEMFPARKSLGGSTWRADLLL